MITAEYSHDACDNLIQRIRGPVMRQTEHPKSETKIKRIGDLLLAQQLITHEQLEEALEFQKSQSERSMLGTILIDKGYVSQEDVTATVASSLGIPFVTLTADMVQPKAVEAVPWALIEKHNLLPVSIEDDIISIAFEDFSNLFIIEELERVTNCRVMIIAATPDNIQHLRDELYPDKAREEANAATLNEFGDFLSEMDNSELTVVEQQDEEDDTSDLETAATDSPVINLVNYIIQNAVIARASDIHIEPEKKGWRVRYRVDGQLRVEMKPPAKLLPAVVSRVKIMAMLDISERRIPQDGGIMVVVNNNPIDLRVSTMPGKFGEKIVLRVIDNSSGILKLESLGLRESTLKPLREIIQEPNGILLVTGPTGSGKSTTLYAALSEIISEKRNISTVEDPVESTIPGVNQFQINHKAGFDFPKALRALLRQDPDVLMIGEIRDVETARLATEASLTGHLVLSTLHTNDAPTAIPRLINMGIESYLVAASLRGVLAQRLVRKICQHCKTKVELDATSKNILNQISADTSHIKHLYQGKGCNRCHNTGHIGRIGVYELLLVNEDILGSLGGNLNISTIRKIAKHHGFESMIVDGLHKVADGLITLEGLLESVAKSE